MKRLKRQAMQDLKQLIRLNGDKILDFTNGKFLSNIYNERLNLNNIDYQNFGSVDIVIDLEKLENLLDVSISNEDEIKLMEEYKNIDSQDQFEDTFGLPIEYCYNAFPQFEEDSLYLELLPQMTVGGNIVVKCKLYL